MLFVISGRAYSETTAQTFLVLNYHDIVENPADGKLDDRFAITKNNLDQHFGWLQKNNYHVVDIQTLLDAKIGKKTLPDKAVILTFDDGYQSFYTLALPLLKKYHYPATIAIVGNWLDKQSALDAKSLMSAD